MAGGLMQLVAYGAQDVYLTANPQITFWKRVYRKYTNFAMEEIKQTPSNSSPSFGNQVTYTIARNGDLMSNCFLEAEIEVPGLSGGPILTPTEHFMERLIKSVEVQIGGQTIETQYGLWMHMWNRLTLSDTKLKAYNYMIGSTTDKGANSPFLDPDSNVKRSKLNLPLQFWFCKNPGLAIPLLALQYHEVKFKVQIATSEEVQFGSGQEYLLTGLNLWVNYTFLAPEERRRFIQTSHEYLITQVQFDNLNNLNIGSNETKLNFNHPVIELMWVNYKHGENTAQKWSSFWNYIDSATLYFNTHKRFLERDGTYFDTLQPFTYHTNNKTGVNVYSFALYPENASEQPSGSANFSRLDNVQLSQTLKDTFDANGNIYIYALNYNILRVMSGMGGLAYSN
jgi:hypothetical protein